jgi:hypothetical protein
VAFRFSINNEFFFWKNFSLACSGICFEILAAKDESKTSKLIEVTGFEDANKEVAEVVGCESPTGSGLSERVFINFDSSFNSGTQKIYFFSFEFQFRDSKN